VDSTITRDLYEVAVGNAWLGRLSALIADYGIFLLPLALTGVWLADGRTRSTRRRAVLAGCLAAAAAMCLGLVLERTLARPRPFVALGIVPLLPHVGDSSFPSDHTLVGVALVGMLAWHVPRVGLWLAGWALLVGVARVTLGLHYPSDIVGSALLALVVGGVAWMLVASALETSPSSVSRRLGL